MFPKLQTQTSSPGPARHVLRSCLVSRAESCAEEESHVRTPTSESNGGMAAWMGAFRSRSKRVLRNGVSRAVGRACRAVSARVSHITTGTARRQTERPWRAYFGNGVVLRQFLQELEER
jgi:hypothetical protein